MIRLRDFWIYYLLTFLFLALLPILAILFNDGSMDFSAAAKSATEQTGVEWNSNILNVLRLSLAEPLMLLTLLGSLAPAFAAIAVLLFLNDKALWSNFRRRLSPWRDCSVSSALLTYLSIFLLLVPTLFIVYEFRSALGAEYDRSITFSFSLVTAVLAIALLDQGALLEEIGWRGFAGPELQRVLSHPLTAAIIIGVCWGLWHIPRDVTTDVIGRLGFVTYATQFLPAFLLGTISVSIIAAFFMNRLGGSLIAAIIIHGLTNDAVGISGSASIVEALTPFHQITKNLPFALIALGLVLFTGTRLGLREKLGSDS